MELIIHTRTRTGIGMRKYTIEIKNMNYENKVNFYSKKKKKTVNWRTSEVQYSKTQYEGSTWRICTLQNCNACSAPLSQLYRIFLSSLLFSSPIPSHSIPSQPKFTFSLSYLIFFYLLSLLLYSLLFSLLLYSSIFSSSFFKLTFHYPLE